MGLQSSCAVAPRELGGNPAHVTFFWVGDEAAIICSYFLLCAWRLGLFVNTGGSFIVLVCSMGLNVVLHGPYVDRQLVWVRLIGGMCFRNLSDIYFEVFSLSKAKNKQ